MCQGFRMLLHPVWFKSEQVSGRKWTDTHTNISQISIASIIPVVLYQYTIITALSLSVNTKHYMLFHLKNITIKSV